MNRAQINKAARLWLKGHSSFDIATEMEIGEAAVWKALTDIKIIASQLRGKAA